MPPIFGLRLLFRRIFDRRRRPELGQSIRLGRQVGEVEAHQFIGESGQVLGGQQTELTGIKQVRIAAEHFQRSRPPFGFH